eukprot:scaffold243440_cov27-Prasinocladus_malaysianus.AAC.1
MEVIVRHLIHDISFFSVLKAVTGPLTSIRLTYKQLWKRALIAAAAYLPEINISCRQETGANCSIDLTTDGALMPLSGSSCSNKYNPVIITNPIVIIW